MIEQKTYLNQANLDSLKHNPKFEIKSMSFMKLMSREMSKSW